MTSLRILAFSLCIVSSLQSETVTISSRSFVIPDGYELRLAIKPGLTERPIVVDFDHEGHLYVAESSGTNNNVQKQLKEKPHSILCLSDTDNDGVFDKRTVFADRMMFPEGVLCHQGSVYVAAPPQILKLTDTDDDGVADDREVWFDAKTLTGCANDLHGPYAGLDGLIYWCKGAFAEQTYEQSNGIPFVTRAAHIFRRSPKGGTVHPVMTGGMDNPVEVVFTETGERIFNTTFFQHPANGQRDGLVHAIYGGVYGKRHGVIDGHPRTGDLMPVMTHLGAAAPSGLVRLESKGLAFENQLLTACFNLHSITRHKLTPHGATYKTKDTVLVSSDDLDFHPTDVIEDADGSVLIVDTGGWYKLCCPTSQLHKPDVPGAIYRLEKTGAKRHLDPRGLDIEWSSRSPKQLATLLADNRFAVRRRAIEELGTKRDADTSVSLLCQTVSEQGNHRAALNAIWAACRIAAPPARRVARLGLDHEHPRVRQAATHTVSLYPWDKTSSDRLIALLGDESLHVQRAAAEAIGRLAVEEAVPNILDRLDEDIDRTLQHSLIYALIEIGPAAASKLLPVLGEGSTKQQRAALTAIIGMRNREQALSQEELLRLLSARDSELRSLAVSIAEKRPEWSESFAEFYRQAIQEDSSRLAEFRADIGTLAGQPDIDDLIVELLTKHDIEVEAKSALLQHVPFSASAIKKVLPELLRDSDSAIVATVVRKLAERKELGASLRSELLRIAKSGEADAETRLLAAQQMKSLDSELFAVVVGLLSGDQPARVRSLALSVLENAELEEPQLIELAKSVPTVGALELSRLLRIFEQTETSPVGTSLFASLTEANATSTLPPELLASLTERFGDDVAEFARPLLAASDASSRSQSERLRALLGSLPPGDIRRGQKLFHDERLACFTCHAIGYRGGTVGPDLSRIGRTRARPDLLEAIMYPSASFVRSYEPVTVLTTDGRQLSGTIRDQSSDGLKLQLNATETKIIDSDEIEEILPGKVSIMPSGLDKQLTNEQLADLLAFLESRK